MYKSAELASHIKCRYPQLVGDGVDEWSAHKFTGTPMPRSVWIDGWWRTVKYDGARMCVHCALVVGTPFDYARPRPETDDGLEDELALCEANQ